MAAIQKIKNKIAKASGYKGAMYTVGFSERNVAATLRSIIPVCSCLRKQYSMQEISNKPTANEITIHQIPLTMPSMINAMNTR